MKRTKLSRVFDAFLSGRSFNRFEAERELHDHCLHTTVSMIQQQKGVTVSRSMETVLGYQGNPTRCCRYWIAPSERQRFINESEGK